MSSLRTQRRRPSLPALRWATAVAAALLFAPTITSAAPNEMTRDEIVAIAKTVPGFSYWWGGSKWSPGASAKGLCTPKAGSSGCPSCTHSGSWGADCSGFVGKAWQIAVPKSLTVAYHPYATVHFAGQSTWWTSIKRSSAQKADAFNYNTNGAGHIFLYEKGDPWGSVWAWECAGCKPGCKYNLRSVSSSYTVKQRKLLKSPVTTCKPHCEGSVIVDTKCGKGDCAKYGSKCVNDSLGVRCVFGMCPNAGSATICLPDGKLGGCKNGALAQSGCASGKHCVKLTATSAACKPVCPKTCDDGNPCTKDACDAKVGTCSHDKLTGNVCTDGSKCTGGETCQAGVCKGGKAIKSCDDGNPCTSDGCVGATGSCSHKASAGACDDGDACTTGDGCKGGNCVGGAAKVCSDGDACNGVEICVGGACKAGTSSACDDGNICTIDACDAKTGACSHIVAVAACDDGNACTTDQCAGASCHHLPVQGSCGDGTWTCADGLCAKPGVGGSTDADAGGSGSGVMRDGADGPQGAETDTLSGEVSSLAGGDAATATRPAGTSFAPAPSSGCAATRSAGSSTAPSALWLVCAMLLLVLRRRRFGDEGRVGVGAAQ